jgi:bacterioferritin
MENHDKLIEVLNQAVSLEYTAVVQYNQHSMLLTGPDREVFEELFTKQAEEALTHAKTLGEKIVYLGGVPTIEVGEVHQSTSLTEMLEMDLELETQAVETYSLARDVCGHQPTAYLLEDQIIAEQDDVERLAKLLGQVRIAKGAVSVSSAVRAV